jgi:hypothetical protein
MTRRRGLHNYTCRATRADKALEDPLGWRAFGSSRDPVVWLHGYRD